MAMQYEATLRLKGDDQTAEAFRSASDSARQFSEQQTRATRGLREDVDSVGRAFRGLGKVMALGGVAGLLTQAVNQAANFGDKLNRIGINARASEETMRRVGVTLRQEASRLNLDIDKVVEGYDAWRVASGQSVEAALQSFPAISEAAKAMNADVSAVGAAMGSLGSNLRLSAGDMRVTLDQMARAAGDIGVPFEEFARNFGGMAEQMQRLGIQGAAGTEQILGLFTAIQGRTNDANQTFRVMGELMNDLTSNDLLAGRMGQGRVQQIIQDVVANGGNVVDALGKIIEKLYGARMESPRVRAEMEAAFGRDVVKLIFETRDGLIDVEGATNRVRNSSGEMGQRLAQELASPREPLTALKREFGDILTSVGEVAIKLNEAFGSNNRSLLANTADELKQVSTGIGTISEALQTGKWREGWEKLGGPEAVKDFFQMPKFQRPGWLGGGKQAGGPVEAGRPYVVGEAGPEMFVPNQSGKILPRALYGAALAAEYGFGVRGASTAAAGALGGHGGAAGGQSFGQVMTGAIPGAGILGAMKTDAESGHPLRTKLRGMLGLEDPGEPAPWQAGGQWRQKESDAPDVVATRANTDAVSESTEQQTGLIEQLTDLNNSLRRLLGGRGGGGTAGGGVAAGGGGGGEPQLMQASFGGGGAARIWGGAGGWGGGRAMGGGGGGLAGRRISGGGGWAGGGGATGAWPAPAAPAASAAPAGGGGGADEAAYSAAAAKATGGGGKRGDLYSQRAPLIMRDLQRDLGLTKEQAAGLVGNLGYESAGFKALQEGKPIGGAGGFGYAQWTGPRRTAFMRYAQSRGLDPKSHEANVGFLKHELATTHKGFLNRLKQTKSVEQASRLTHEVYESPADVQPKYWGRTLPGLGRAIKPYESAGGRLSYARRAHAMGGGPEVASAATEPAGGGAPEPAAAAATPAPLGPAPDRAELEKPIPLRFEHQPGETQMRRTSIAREVDRSVREATLNSYAEFGIRLMLFQWGALQFDITPFNVHEADQMTATDWARKEIAGAAIYREWVGEGDEEIALRGRVFPHRLGGLTELEILESFRRQGKAEQLMRGDGTVLGWYVLERLARAHRFLGADGIGQQINFEGNFMRCPVPDPNAYFPMLYQLIR